MDGKILERLRIEEEVYTILSDCTRMPFVVCDAETFDDEILIYFTEEEAQKKGKEFIKAGEPVQLVKLDKANRLSFFLGLFPMGVNCILVNAGMEGERRVQLEELVTRPEADHLPDGKIRVENPELYLTALYLLQKTRRRPRPEEAEEIKELNEEMMAHFQRGMFVLAVEEGKGVPILKQKDGLAFQPIFTDVQEMRKFQMLSKGVVLQVRAVEAAKLPQILSPEVAGVTINPFGINLQLQMNHKKGE